MIILYSFMQKAKKFIL